jgi:hypothetical protein
MVVSMLLGCGLFPRRAEPTPVPALTGRGATPVLSTGATSSAATGVAATAVAATGTRGATAASLKGGTPGMIFTLSEGAEQPQAPSAVRLVSGEPLSDAALAQLLGRLPPLEGQADDQVAFRLPAQTLPAPRPGQTVEQPFPPQEAAAAGEPPPVGPLQVLRYSPEGDVPLAPFLSITFDQPLVALTTIAQLRAQEIPVRLTPLPEGSWRWVGTKTLLFEPITRFPMATEYQVEAPAGTRSATGGLLASAVRWTFRTPPPQVVTTHPVGGPTVREPLMFVAFDQQIEPAAVVEMISLSAGGRAYAARRASTAEVQSDDVVRSLAERAGAGRWVAFFAVEPLPADTTVTVNIGAGTPSAEGPLTTTSVQSFAFVTYGPLAVNEARCGWGNECPPLSPWFIRFSNPLNQEAFEPSWITVSPELPDMSVSASGNTVTVRGRSAGRTTYEISIAPDVLDTFGQTLGQEARRTIKVGSANPSFYAPGESFVVLDPVAPPAYSAFTINYSSIKVQAYAVQPEDWPEFQRYLRESYSDESKVTPPGRKVLDRSINTRGEADRLTETRIDLSGLYRDGHRHLVLVIAPEQGLLSALQRRQSPPVRRMWVQMSDIAVDALVDGSEMLAWATRLSDGQALSGAGLTLYPGKVQATTGQDGLARLNLGYGKQDEGAFVVARRGNDAALLPESAFAWYSGWPRDGASDSFRWYVWDDRQMYRPGEEVRVKGWVRLARVAPGKERLELPGTGSVSWGLTDAQGNRVLQGSAPLNALGGFDLGLTLPEAMNLGGAQLHLSLASASGAADYYHQIQVQEFRRPEFEVKASVDPGPYFVGDAALAAVEALYYAGGPLPGADVTWSVTAQPGAYRPPNWDEFDFGIWTPWWISWRGGPESGETQHQSFAGLTDASGKHLLRIAFEGVEPPRPTVVRAEASVMDVNRQAWAASTQMLVHPADLYVGLRSQPTFVERGDPIRVDAIVTDLDGKLVLGIPISLRAVRLKWQYLKGQWQEIEVDEQICALHSAQEPVRCTFQTPEGGTYRLSATIADTLGRRNLTQITRWVSGGERPTALKIELEDVTLIPDRAEYQPGQTAQILVQAPFVPAEGLLTVQCNGLVRHERFSMHEPSVTLQVAIGEDDVPNVWVQVDLVGAAPRLDATGEPDGSLPERPAYATGSLNLSVPAYKRTLSVSVTPRVSEIEPGGETVVDVQVRDAAGQAVRGAEVALVVVDEAVLALTGYELVDPIAVFYPQRPDGVGDYRLRQYVLLVDPALLAQEGVVMQAEMPVRAMMPMAAMPSAAPETMLMGKGGALDEADEAAPIRVRSDFNPLALFAPETPTDADGSASVTLKLPDSLTRYRIMAVAVAGEKRFGKAESAITARLPLMVRPSAPRFLNFGDRFDLPVVLQNQTDAPLEVQVALQAVNLTLAQGAGRRVSVPAHDRVEVRFSAETVQAGTARLLVGAASGRWADAAQLALPVYTPATTEAFAVYGVVDQGALAQPLIAPSGIYTQFGGLEITTSSTALQALTDAFLYLVAYPYECSEQLASRILAVAALRDVLEAFQAEGLPAPEQIDSAVKRDIERLQNLQNWDGGFPVWTKGRESWPFHTIHAAHALARARQKDYAVSEETVQRALRYLREIETHYPHYYSEDARRTLTAYALYTRMQLGDHDPAKARQILTQAGLENLQPEALGWLYNVLVRDASSREAVQQIERHLANRVVETAGAAHFVTSFREEDSYLLLASDRRADGIILEGLIAGQPQSDLIPKIVQGLLAHRKAGRWGNTQENVFVLLALDRYFATYEAQTPDFVARAWLGADYLGQFAFKGRTTEYQALNVPMSFVTQQPGQQDLILSKDGVGRLYYRLGIRYAPTDLRLAPLDQGFVVERRYEAVDDPLDVTQDAQGTWRIKAGARVRVRLTMVAPTRRYHVALADPLPAGLEPMNPALAVTGSIPQDPNDQSRGGYWWWRWTWYEHQNLRDQRAEAFASLLWEGIHTYTYVARATTPGEFIVPPARAEEMYAPETFGRSGTDRVVVQ